MRFATLVLGASLALALSGPARAATIYGSLSNFDCINDTGSTAHGFEIELDNVSSADVLATFGAPYNRYGTPMIQTVGSNTFVRYEASYNQTTNTWSAGTNSGTYGPTGGHALYNGGDPNYPNVPGDHFGVATSVTPSNIVYHWLLDGGNGNLVLAGTAVKMPAPIMNLQPPPQPAQPPVVQAVVQAPPQQPGEPQLPDAIWVKVFTTVVQNPEPIQLNELVQDNKKVVPGETETEVEWQLLQSDPARPDLGEKMDNADLVAGNESIVRRYEFYAYTGAYDPENHEALVEDHTQPGVVGDFLGNQNVALNFAAAVPEPSTLAMGVMAALGMAIWSYTRRRPRAGTAA